MTVPRAAPAIMYERRNQPMYPFFGGVVCIASATKTKPEETR